MDLPIEENLIYCNTCRKYTNQSVVEELQDLAIKSRNSLLQKLQCKVCGRTNERLLQFCQRCQKHTSQSLIEEKNSRMMEETVEQTFKCKVCGEINKTSRDTDDHIRRFLNAKDEEGGVYCGHCMCLKIQELIDKRHSKGWPEYDLTTYRCKTCGHENYGHQKKLDIR